MRSIDHHIVGHAGGSVSGRSGEVFDPNTGQVQATVVLNTRAPSKASARNRLPTTTIKAASGAH